MKLEKLLASAGHAPKVSDWENMELNGAVEADHDPDFIRLYRDPAIRTHYLLIRKDDVRGDVREWTAEERVRVGYRAGPIYRVQVAHGTSVFAVAVTPARVGLDLAGDATLGVLSAAGKCFHTNTCDSGCYWDDGPNHWCSRCCKSSSLEGTTMDPAERYGP